MRNNVLLFIGHLFPVISLQQPEGAEAIFCMKLKLVKSRVFRMLIKLSFKALL